MEYGEQDDDGDPKTHEGHPCTPGFRKVIEHVEADLPVPAYLHREVGVYSGIWLCFGEGRQVTAETAHRLLQIYDRALPIKGDRMTALLRKGMPPKAAAKAVKLNLTNPGGASEEDTTAPFGTAPK